MKLAGDAILAITLAAIGVVCVATWVVGPSISLLGWFHLMALTPAIASLCLLVLEWRSEGRHRFWTLGLAMATATLVAGFVVAGSGLRMLATQLAVDAVSADPTRYRQMLALGGAEAAVFFMRYASTAMFLALLWAPLVGRKGREEADGGSAAGR